MKCKNCKKNSTSKCINCDPVKGVSINSPINYESDTREEKKASMLNDNKKTALLKICEQVKYKLHNIDNPSEIYGLVDLIGDIKSVLNSKNLFYIDHNFLIENAEKEDIIIEKYSKVYYSYNFSDEQKKIIKNMVRAIIY